MKKNLFLTLVLAVVALFSTQTATAQAPVDSPEQAITGLLNRIGGNGAADKFEIVIDADLAQDGKDLFIITSQNGKPCIKGNTQLSVATGINWYLNHHAHINLTWNNLTTDLSAVTLPVPSQEEKHVCNTTYRYDFNTCTFSYSMAFWTWERWQQEIDWMALHGINAPLNLVGLDVVTRKFLRELGVSEADIDAYIAGPGFIAWFAMNNLEGWGGTINANDVTMNGNPDWWYTRQEQLCRNMLQRMRELGMQPVIPGFSGQVPNCIVNYSINGFSSGDVVNNGTWAGGYTRPDILKPNTESYRTFAAVYYKHLHEVMGVSEFYSIDPFHEGSLPSGVSNETCYPNIMVELDNYYNGVSQEDKTKNNVDEAPKWIIQYWQGVPQSGAFSAMSRYGDRFIGLDLFSDAPGKAKWNTDYYQGRPYIFCMLHNFGGRSGMHGRLESTMNDYFRALAKGNNCKGIGATPEGTETNPILYDMLFELPWMDVNNRPTADEWLEEYAYSRYGVENDNALAALQNLKKSVWACPTDQQGTSEAVILARPNWTIGSVSSWSTSAIYWDTQDVLLAADQLSSISDLITTADGTANYNYDFIDVVRQSMVDYAAQLLPLINAARNGGNNSEYTRLYQLYLQLMLDLDEMLSYDENFKLERWTSLARNIANEVSGTTENDRRWLEWNARTQVTVWSKGDTDLHDYSNRCWAGLIKDFHYKRWEKFFTTNGGSFSGGWFSGFEYPWTVDFTNYNYSTVTIPSDMTATAKAKQTFGNYFGRVVGKEKNYLFPMGITTNATKSDVIPEVYRGKTVALPLEIGKTVTISSVWIDLNNDGAASNNETLAVTDGNKVAIAADAAIGKTTAKVTYSDGTVITFNIALIEDITDARTVKAVAGANGSVAIEGADGTTVTNALAVKMIATPNTGYNFEKWTDAQGNTVSNDNPFIYYGKEDATFTANFIQDKWGVVACNGSFSGDIASYAQYIHNLTLAYYNREPETILEATSAPTEIFNTIPTIINVPQGASFDVEYNNGGSDGLKYCYFRAFIDLNADGDFDDEGELLKEVGTNGGQNAAVCSNKINVLLPYDMPLGITHMRLRFDGAWDNSNKPSDRGAKDASIRPVYEIIINVTEFSDKAAHITVATNSEDWGSVKVWTDETPDGSTRTEWDVTKGVKFYMAAEKASDDVEFVGWYDQYGRLVSTELEHTMYAREDATYTARFRKFLEIGGWQIEYRTEPGKDIVTNKLTNGVKPIAGKKYYIYAPTRPTNDGEYVNRYLYNNSGTLTLSTTESTAASYLWLCSIEDGKYVFQNVADPTKYLMHKGMTGSPYGFELGTGTTSYEGITLQSVPGNGESRNLFFVINDDGSGFNQSTRAHNQSTEAYCTDFVFTEVATPDVVILTKVRQSGNHDLVIPETVTILGEQLKIVGFENNLFKNNKDLWTISLPSTIEKLSDNKVFTGAVKGKGANASANTSNYITTDLGVTCAAGENWSISLTIEDNGNNFNQWGSALIATGSAPMNSTYATGFQLYMQSGGGLIVKTDVDGDGYKLTNLAKGTKYRIDIVYTHSNTKLVVTSTPLGAASAAAARAGVARSAAASLEITQDMSDFSVVSHAIPEGVNITNLEVCKGATPDPFEGCTNLLDIEVADGCENYYVNEETGALYSTGDTKLHEVADAEKEEEIRALGELIDLTEALVAEVATNINPTGKATEITLNATQGNDYYIWCNNPHTSGDDGAGGVAALLDEDAGSYLHSNWSSLSSTHDYLQIDFGNAVGLDNFKIAGQQRNSGSNDRPKNIEIYGSNDGTNWTPITTVEGLPNTAGATWESGAISAAERYSHLKFIVKTHDNYNQTSSVSRPYFHMAKFDLLKLTSTAEVANVYKNLAGVTADEVENVYDNLAEALYYYNNGGTADQLTAAYNVLKPLYDALNAKKDNVFNGVYNIKYKGEPIFVAYTNAAVESMSNDVAGYKLFDMTLDGTDAKHQELQNNAIDAKVAADALFTIVPNSELTGYTLSAQGLYLHSTRNGGWAPQLLSADEAQAGVYLFEETETDIYKIKSNRNDIQYINDWGPIFGNDKSNKPSLSTFTLEQVTEYTLIVPANGVTTLCLPFNVVLPAGVAAYDLAKANIIKGKHYNKYELVEVAGENETLAKNTPVIIKADANDYTLTITMDGEGAKASVENSVLRSGLVKTTVAAGNNYTFDGVDFNLVATDTEVAANQCWMELDENLGAKIYGTAPDYVLTTDETDPVLYKIIIKRANDNSKVLSYDEPTSEKVKIVDNAANSSYQAWYFVQGENGIIIKPYNADGRMLTVESTGDGAGKAMIAADGASNFQEWSFTKSTQSGCTDYYYIKVVGGEGNAGTFSHNGGFGVTDYMGIWSGGFNSADGGSLFKFVEAEFTDDNARFYQLNDVLPTLDQGIYTGESVGLYSADGVAALNTKCTEAQALVTAGSNASASDACYAMYKALRAAKKDAYNAPAADKVYYIVSTATGDGHAYCTGKYVHTYSEPHLHQNATWGDKTYDQHHLLFDADGDISQLSLAAFQFEDTGTMGEYKMKNLHTGLYVKSFNNNVEHMGTAADAAVVKIAGIADGQVTLRIGNNSPMHAQNDYSVIVTWTAEPNNPSTWTINEAINLDEIYKLTVPESGVATLNLAFNVVLPEGVTAYDFVESDIAQAEGGERREFTLRTVATDGEVLAKNTPVIIKAIAGEYNLKATFSNDNVKNGTTGSVLRGNYWQTTVGTAEVNYLPDVVDNGLVFNEVTADNTVVTANTVWVVLSTADNGATIYEYVPAPAPPTVEIAAGNVYRIKNYTVNTPDEFKYHYLVNSNVSIAFPTSVEADDKSAMWVCTSVDADSHKYTFVNALGTAAFGWQGVAEDALEYTISDGTIAGTVTLANGTTSLALTTEAYQNSGKVAFNQASNGIKVQHADHWSTDWYFEEVENPGVSFTKSISSENEWATMYLPYAVAIPEGVVAYYAAADDAIVDKTISLTQLDGTIPAKTAVLLHRAEAAAAEGETPAAPTTNEYTFNLAADVEAVDNLFEGKIMQTAISAANAKVYLLIKYNKKEAFYWMADEYNENCVFAGSGAGYVKCDANKGYLKLPNLQGASSYSFRYEGSTGVEEVKGENGKVKAVYDLHGRKLNEITKPGFYIVDGEKVWIK